VVVDVGMAVGGGIQQQELEELYQDKIQQIS